MFMNWMIRLSARATPGTPRTRSTAVSGKVCAKSTLGVFFEVTQISALACSIVTVALASRPMKRPTWTSTSVTAKATPATVIAKRRRSCSRFLRARETISVPAAGGGARRGREAADAGVDHLRDEVGTRRRMRPVLRLQRDEQRDGAVHARPEDLRDGVDVAGTEMTARDGRLHRLSQESEGLLAGRGGVVLGVLELGRRHEHEPVLIRVRGAEARVGQAELADAFDGIGGGRLLLEVLEEPREVLLAERQHEVVLVLEVVVDRGGRVLDGLGDPPHRDPLVPFGHEQLARGLEDPPAHLLALALLPFHDPHGPRPLGRDPSCIHALNYVNL